VLRRATSEDLDALIPLVEAFYAVDHHCYDENRVVSALQPLLAGDTFGQIWVVELKSALVGYAIVTWGYSLESGGRECLVDEIFIAEQSQGLGGILLETALKGARVSGASAVFLETETHNARVRAFYSRHGFAVEESVWMRRSL
jgi:GNAT superfamily N-acetyltransferase